MWPRPEKLRGQRGAVVTRIPGNGDESFLCASFMGHHGGSGPSSGNFTVFPIK
jgi:hypothetical protein